MAIYVSYRTDCHSKQANAASIMGTMTIPLSEPVFLRFARDFCRVICLQDHSMFRQEAARVCEQSQF
jgi:hypothetical protein